MNDLPEDCRESRLEYLEDFNHINLHARRRIWEGLRNLNNKIKAPWIVGGDFNVIYNWNEKRGGRLADDGSMMEFNSFITQSGLTDISLNNSALSWTNNQQGSCRIYKKLDRVLINSEAMIKILGNKSVYLPRVQSDQMPMLISFGNSEVKAGSFIFLYMWCDHEDFYKLVEDCWKFPSHSNGLVNLHMKLKFMKLQFKNWNRQVFGHVDRNIEILTQKVQDLDEQLVDKWSEEIFSSLQVKKDNLVKWENRKFGDRNTNVFHTAIKDQARRNKISLKLDNGTETDDPDAIGNLASKFFSDRYQGSRYFYNENLFSYIPKLIYEADNDLLTRVPLKDEIKNASFLHETMRAFGFNERWIDMIFRLHNNCWYSIRVQNQVFGLFKASCGLRQGDPLALALFTMVMDVFIRNLKFKIEQLHIQEFQCSRGVKAASHLLFGDDVLIFSNGSLRSVRQLKLLLHDFCHAFGQIFNQDKSNFFGDQKRFHWIAWYKIAKPIEEGGLNLKLLTDSSFY
uniref:Reverse transcriptase domain-containing protein n=1 Tax=Kalanchoe fedtschenkoi TaxID=63787 RepID=A0A7N0UY89_KALFE